MAKKKSKRFIIPSFHFITTNPPVKKEADLENPVRITNPPAARVPVKKSQLVSNHPPAADPKAPEKISRPKPPVLKQPGRRKSALSLSSLKRNKEEEALLKKKQQEQREQVRDLPKDPFTEAAFLNIWTAYVDELHHKGEKILASILKADTPKVKANKIYLTYPNELMKVELLKVRPKVLRYLRKKLNNYEIDFEVTVNEDTTKRFAYTPQEKYELLKDKNEAIVLLRKKFNLEL